MTKPFLDVKTLSPTEQALYAYLDDMLREVTESPEASLTEAETIQTDAIQTEAIQTEAIQTIAVQAETTHRETPEVETPEVETFQEATLPAATEQGVIEDAIALVAAATDVPVSAAVILEQTVFEPATARPASRETLPAASEMISAPGWADNGRPLWAQSRFDVLIFKVAGLKLAVPLVSLGLIYPIDKKFHALPHQSDWFLGMLRVPGGNIKVIDTARHVMPERYTPACRDKLKFVITLHGYEWGLACHEVHKAMGMEPDAINWRTQRSKRPWMAGTVREHMCALIDTAGFHRVIEAVEQHPPR